MLIKFIQLDEYTNVGGREFLIIKSTSDDIETMKLNVSQLNNLYTQMGDIIKMLKRDEEAERQVEEKVTIK